MPNDRLYSHGPELDDLPPPDDIEELPELPASFASSTVFDHGARFGGSSAGRLRGAIMGGRYALDRSIRRGAFHHLFAARHIHLDQPRVLKCLRRQWASDALLREETERSARAMASVVHPSVARVLDAFVEDTPCVVMEYVPGETLLQLLERDEAIHPQRALRLALGLCQGLVAVHGARLLHRDIRPCNVIVSDDDAGSATLVGFTPAIPRTYLAGGMDSASEETERSTDLFFDERGDVYCVGRVLYQTLMGTTAVGTEVDVAALSRRLQSGDAAANRRILALVERALARSAADRFDSAATMADALRDALPRSATAARPAAGAATAPPTNAAPARTNVRRFLFWSLLLMGLVMALAFAYARWPWSTPARDQPIRLKQNR